MDVMFRKLHSEAYFQGNEVDEISIISKDSPKKKKLIKDQGGG